jgi:hypothetical protein
VDPDMLVNIEQVDTTLGRIEGLQVASEVLLDAAGRAGIRTSDPATTAAEGPTGGRVPTTADGV